MEDDNWVRPAARAPLEVTAVNTLRALFDAPAERAGKQQISALDEHWCRFIAVSPFPLQSTCDKLHPLDASPRRGAPRVVHVAPETN